MTKYQAHVFHKTSSSGELLITFHYTRTLVICGLSIFGDCNPRVDKA